MADIEVTLGARNEASRVLREFQAEVGQTAQSIQFSVRGLAQLAGATAAVVALVEAGRALTSFTTSSISAFDQTNKSAIKLSETLGVIPGVAKDAASELRKTAESLEGITNIDAGKIMDAMTGALRRGADPANIDEMAEAAIGLSRVFDRDLATSMRMVEEATKGNFDAFRGLIPKIDEMATNSEKLAAVEQLAEAGLTNKAKAAREAIEASDALSMSTNKLLKTVGELLAPIRDVIYRGFTLFFDFLTNQMNPSLKTFDDLVGQVRSTVEGFAMSIAESFVTGFTIAESAVVDFGKVLQIAVDSATLQIVRLSQEVPHQLVGMASQLTWFVENIGAISAVVAMGKTTFAEAFEDMPTIADRAITDTEKALQTSINRTANDLVGGYSERLKARLDQLKKGFDFKAEIELKERPGSKNPLTDTLRELQAFESRVLTRGPGTSPIDKLVQNTTEANKHLQAIETNLTSPSDQPKQEIIFSEVMQ
jgi:hypothetical protein